MNFNIFNSLMLAGAIQGIVFALVVFCSKKYYHRANFLLAFLIIAFALNNLQYYVYDIELINRLSFYQYIFFPFEIICPAFYLLYINSLIHPKQYLSRKEKLLFIPFLIFLLSVLFLKIYSFSQPVQTSLDLFYEFEFWHESFANLFSIIVFITAYISVKKFILSQTNLDSTFINMLKWIRLTTLILLGICVIWPYGIYEGIYNEESNLLYVLSISISFIIYWLGHIGIYKYGIILERKKLREYANIHQPKIKETLQPNKHITALENFIISEKNYLDNTLTLEKTAEKLQLNKSHLSRIIKTELNTGFIDYVNELRIEEAKKYLENPEFANYTLVSIGLEAGFNSKSTFNTAFKKFTGMTPSEYRKKVSNE